LGIKFKRIRACNRIPGNNPIAFVDENLGNAARKPGCDLDAFRLDPTIGRSDTVRKLWRDGMLSPINTCSGYGQASDYKDRPKPFHSLLLLMLRAYKEPYILHFMASDIRTRSPIDERQSSKVRRQ